ncbi:MULTISPECIES: alpha/beta hydrolase [unclassified Nocardia]|uniref:alpha/beta hydrolase n=1 Tax=unclassified Nocardia TaxID=2637762 RepID=UPI001CE48491|nr:MULTISPECIES: alpha/beta hydrolase [unclassified Nocardia]
MHDSYLAFLPDDLRPDPGLRPESTWWRWRGARIHIERVPRSDAAVRMLLVHGGGGHAAVMWPFAALAARQGFEVLVPDLPGYGRSEVESAGAVRYSDWVDCVADLVRAEKAADPRPLVVFGASMGGMLAYEAAARTGMVEAIAVTCLLDPRSPLARRHIGRFRWLGQYGAPLLVPVVDGVRVPMRLVANMTAMSNLPDLTATVVADPRGGGVWIPLGFLRTYLCSAPLVEPENFTACPVWLLHPGADRWTPLAVSRMFFDRIAAPKHLLVLDRAGHYPVEDPGIRQLATALADIHRWVCGIG